MFNSLYIFLIIVGSLIIGLALGARLRQRRGNKQHPEQ